MTKTGKVGVGRAGSGQEEGGRSQGPCCVKKGMSRPPPGAAVKMTQ